MTFFLINSFYQNLENKRGMFSEIGINKKDKIIFDKILNSKFFKDNIFIKNNF